LIILFLIFSLFTIPLFFIFFSLDDKTRFKPKEITSIKIPSKLKVVLFAELLYWFAMASSFALVITFLVTDYFGSSIFWIGVLFFGLYFSIVVTTFITKKYFERKDLFISAILGMILLFLSALVVIISKNLYTVLFAMILEGIGAAIWVPSKWLFIGS